ncbi:MAG TPA: hypothetical protein VIM89_07765 [Mucilaginibacter sp.]
MTNQLTSLPTWAIPSLIILAILYFLYIIWPYPQIRLYYFKRHFFRAILKVTSINDTSNTGAAGQTWDQLNQLSWEELKLDFKTLMEKHGRFKNKYKNASTLFEECLYYLDTKGSENLAFMTDLTVSNNTRAKIINLIRLARNENPFLGLPSKEANLLTIINQSLIDKNVELGRSSLIQLSQEIEQMVVSMEGQERRNIVSYIVSIVGVILTIIFGLISLRSLF